ncbi:MAG: MoaD/ThiS family protein [Nitrososphaeria archaeon]
MARVKLRVFYELIDMLGAHEVEAEAETISDLLDQIVKRYGEGARRAILGPNNEIHEHLLVYVNNRHIKKEEYGSTKLNVGDLVMILPPVGGGS